MIPPNSLSFSCDVAREKLNSSQFDEAIKLSRECFDTNCNHADCHFVLGKAYRLKLFFSRSIQILEQSILLYPKKEDLYHELSLAYKQNGELEKYIRTLQKCLEINPKYEFALSNLGEYYYDNQNYLRASQYLEKYFEIHPEKFKYFHLLEACFNELNDSDLKHNFMIKKSEIFIAMINQKYGAQDKLAQQSQKNQKNRNVTSKSQDALNLGRSLIHKQSYYEALKVLKDGLAIDTNSLRSEFFALLGFVYTKLRQDDEAVRLYFECLKLEPFNPAVNYNLGVFFQNKDQILHANLYFKQYLKYEISQIQFSKICQIYLKLNQLEKLIDQFKKIIKKSKNEVSQYLKRAKTLI